jgi:hypothetical protein
LRHEIDEVDRHILELVAKRLKLAEKIARAKQQLGIPIADVGRERRVIERIRKRAGELKIDRDFAEGLVRYLMAWSVGKQRERIESPSLWSRIAQVFEGYPAQLEVLKFLLKHGLRVGDDGNIYCDGIKIPLVQLAREIGVDRRTVEMTAKKILRDAQLRHLFQNLESVAFLRRVAGELGLGVIEIIPDDAAKPGIVKSVTEVVASAGISIRQVMTDDPYISTAPKLTIITEGPIRGEIIEALRKIPHVKSIIVY